MVKGKIKHEKIMEIMRPSYILAIFASVITLLVTLFLAYRMISAGTGGDGTVALGIFIHSVITLLIIVSTLMLKREHMVLAGIMLLLCSSIVGVSFAVGLIIGPVLGIIAGIMGMMEHEKLIKHHYL